MKNYKVAILIDPNYAGEIPEILERYNPAYTEKKTVSTPDNDYYVYYWDWEPFYNSNEYVELRVELGRVRHSFIEISEEGEIYVDNQIEDEWGVDGEIEQFLSWDGSITLNDEPINGISSKRLLDILKTYIDDDESSSGFHNYVVEKLRDICGCTDAELKILGYGKNERIDG